MMQAKKIGPLVALIILAACGASHTPEELWQMAENNLEKQDFKHAIKALKTLVAAYPDDALAPQAQFRLGDIYMNNTHDLAKSLKAYQRTAEQYVGTGEGIKALFMIGFVNANYLNQMDAARKAYESFLHQYPDDELAPSVKFELENLGKSIDQIEELKGVVSVG